MLNDESAEGVVGIVMEGGKVGEAGGVNFGRGGRAGEGVSRRKRCVSPCSTASSNSSTVCQTGN